MLRPMLNAAFSHSKITASTQGLDRVKADAHSFATAPAGCPGLQGTRGDHPREGEGGAQKNDGTRDTKKNHRSECLIKCLNVIVQAAIIKTSRWEGRLTVRV